MLFYVSNMAFAQWIRLLEAIELGAYYPSRRSRGEPGGSSLSFASPKESNQSSRSGGSLTSRSEVMRTPKGDPQSGSLRSASGNFRCSKSAEFLETSLLCSRRTSKNLIPLPPALLSPARTGLRNEFGFGVHAGALRSSAHTEGGFGRNTNTGREQNQCDIPNSRRHCGLDPQSMNPHHRGEVAGDGSRIRSGMTCWGKPSAAPVPVPESLPQTRPGWAEEHRRQRK